LSLEYNEVGAEQGLKDPWVDGRNQDKLGGGLKDLFIYTPKIGGNDSHFDVFFFRWGGEKPPTRKAVGIHKDL